MSQTWVIKDTAPVDDASYVFTKTDISFTSGGEKFVGIEMFDEGMTHVGLAYYRSDGTVKIAATMYYGDPGLAWFADNEKYKTLEFDTAPTGELLAWLQKNADAPIIDNLVTDRTQADVERVKALAGKGFAAMTSDEQAEWLAGMKGAYNASDLNRVGTALNYLAGRLAPLCGKNIQWSAKTDWSMTDVITAPQAAVYRKQIQDVRDALTYPDGTPAVPEIDRMTYTGANDIERILALCETLIDNIIKAFRYTGAAECAAGGLI